MKQLPVRIYHIVHVNKRGQHTQCTQWPMPHKQCCTMKSKMMQPAECMLVECTITDEEWESLPQWCRDDIQSATY